MRAKEFEIKKRDPNWRAMQDIRRSGAGGQHKDKKKAEKQGYEKHKSKDVAEDKAGWSIKGSPKPAPKGPMPSWRLNKDGTATDLNTGITYNRDGSVAKKKEGVSEGDYPDGSSLKTPSPEEWQKEYEKAKMAVKNAKTQQEYEAASDRAGRIKDLLASKGIKVSAVLEKESVEEASDFGEPREVLEDVLRTLEREVEWPLTDVMDPREVKQLLAPIVKAVNDKMMGMEEGRRDYGYDDFGNSLRPGSDEGNTEPPNNFAIYINGKKWKVFQGRGQYADDQYEMKQFRQLQAMAQRKSQESGKKWEVSRTLEPATK